MITLQGIINGYKKDIRYGGPSVEVNTCGTYENQIRDSLRWIQHDVSIHSRVLKHDFPRNFGGRIHK
jgi:hypothetical protein